MTTLSKPSPNHSSRRGTIIDTVVLHSTASDSLAGTISWFEMTASRVSAHYVIGKNGTVIKCVQTRSAAWHAGHARLVLSDGHIVTNVNQRSIGIEMVNLNDGHDPYPATQVRALKALLASLKTAIPSLTYLVGHYEINENKTDPKGLPWSMHDLRAWAGWST